MTEGQRNQNEKIKEKLFENARCMSLKSNDFIIHAVYGVGNLSGIETMNGQSYLKDKVCW